jgi:hypothetical protein
VTVLHRFVAATAVTAALALAPAARADLALSAPTPAEQAVLTWSDAGAPSYSIDRVPVVAGVCSLAPPDFTTTTSALTYTDSPPDGAYCYTVTGLTLSPAPVSTVQVVVDTTPPLPPPVLEGSLRYVNAAPVLSWPASPSPDVVSYTVTRDGGTAVGQTAGLTITDTSGPLADGLHTYEIVASDGLHTSTPADITLFFDATPPDAPSGVGAAVRPGSTVVDVSWTTPADPGDAPSGLDDVMLRRTLAASAADGPADGTLICAVHPSQTACRDDGAAQGTTYRYSAFAVDRAGNVSAAGVAQVTTPDLTPPGAAGKLRVIRHGQAVSLRWSPASDRDLARSVVISQTGHAPRSPSDGRQAYAGTGARFDTTLAVGETRWFAVFEVDVHGLVSRPVSVSATVPASRLLPVDGTIATGPPPLSWQRVRHARYYDIQIWSGSRKLAEAWPSKAHWQPPKAKLAGATHITWYVWPGFGSRSAANYGPEIGHARLTIR